MKNILIFLLLLALLAMGGYIFLAENGHNMESILNAPKRIALKVDCSAVEDLLVTSTVTVTVSNGSSYTHNNVRVKVTAYDEAGGVLKEKEALFSRSLPPDEKISKPITLPSQTQKCDCVILDSDPVE